MQNDKSKSKIYRSKIKIYGDVQGVTFRWHTKQKADQLGLVGFVRNEPDGSVLVIAQGQKDKLDELKEWIKEGPSYARVDRVEVKSSPATGQFSDFQIEL